MIYCFDLDETLCTNALNGDYATANPIQEAIAQVNRLHLLGNKILIFTGRGSSSGKDWVTLTENQLIYTSHYKFNSIEYNYFCPKK
jgi:hypothetical protein